MDIQEIRRENLRKWVRENGTPPKEKSYFSQVLGEKASLGEKAARRLEKDYNMGDGYLDSAATNPTSIRDDLGDAVKLLALYRASSEVGRKFIMTAAEAAEKLHGQPS